MISVRAYERQRFGLYDDARSYVQDKTHGVLFSPEHDLCDLAVPIASEIPCFSARLYKSGELSGAYFVGGLSSKVKPPERTGPVETSCFTAKSRSKIRRAVENTSSELITFLTLTFSPWDAHRWELSEYRPLVAGLSSTSSVKPARRSRSKSIPSPKFAIVPRVSCKRRKSFTVMDMEKTTSSKVVLKTVSANVVMPIVRQDYAKHRLKNLRMAFTQKVNRQIACKLRPVLLPLGCPDFVGPLSAPLVGPPVYQFSVPYEDHAQYVFMHKYRMVWTAELQKNGNIHFHALTNKYFAYKYIVKLWPYGMSQIKKLKDAEHAVNYMTKYMTSDDKHGDLEIIKGNRYNISRILREEARPTIYGMEGGDACEARRALKLMKHIIEAKGGRVIDSGFGFVIPRPRRSHPYIEKSTGLKKWTHGVDARLSKGFLAYWFPVREAFRDSGPVPF